MLKNRDVGSNPYRIPPQPTPVWVKASISLITLLLLSTMGGVLFLILARMDCPCVKEKLSLSNKKRINSGEMSDQSEVNDKRSGSADLLRSLNGRVIDLDNDLLQIKKKVTEVEVLCRSSFEGTRDRYSGGRSTSRSKSQSEIDLLDKVARIDSYAKGLETKLANHIGSERKICREGHWRHGVYCYVIMEASFDQAQAKNWCSESRQREGEASLAIIKDKFAQNFIAAKLTERQNSYWIGIERGRSNSLIISLPETRKSGLAPSSVRSSELFFYTDGTRVQKGVWNMWRPGGGSGSTTGARDCVAMTFDHSSASWRWEERDCSENMSYICQYYILTTQ